MQAVLFPGDLFGVKAANPATLQERKEVFRVVFCRPSAKRATLTQMMSSSSRGPFIPTTLGVGIAAIVCASVVWVAFGGLVTCGFVSAAVLCGFGAVGVL